MTTKGVNEFKPITIEDIEKVKELLKTPSYPSDEIRKIINANKEKLIKEVLKIYVGREIELEDAKFVTIKTFEGEPGFVLSWMEIDLGRINLKNEFKDMSYSVTWEFKPFIKS